jgi:Flp pilus assembly protein protease CpaA
MFRWGILLVLIGLLVACFFSGSAGGQLVGIGQWLIGAAIVLWVLWLIFSGLGRGPSTPSLP